MSLATCSAAVRAVFEASRVAAEDDVVPAEDEVVPYVAVP